MQKYDPKKIEKKWQKFWDKNKTFEAKEDANKPKFYSLIEFPYPSGAGLHVGHPRPFTAMDVISRKKRMEGFNVLYPIGFDAFGLPTENFAIKTGRQPAEVTAENIANFTRQLKSLGYSFDWSRAVDTTDPTYYKWTQWIFLQFFKHGLAYKKMTQINWCPKDKIGLANEEAAGGVCDRCGGPVEKRNKEQWMLAITKYADKLLDGLKEVDYITPARVSQENWIGRSEGAEIMFDLKVPGQEDDKHKVTVFTTRPDTIFGATFLAISAELAKKWVEVGWQASAEVKKYVAETLLVQAKTANREEEIDKTGVDSGVKAVNPANGETIPVWVTNYVLPGYGTGAIMAVPAHDERDFEFAKKYKLPIKQVVAPEIVVTGNAAPKDGKELTKRDVVSIIIRHASNGKFLILKRKDGHKQFVGGGIDDGEDVRTAALREIREESGYTDIKLYDEAVVCLYGHGYKGSKDVNCYDFDTVLFAEVMSDKQVGLSEEDQKLHEIVWLDEKEIEKEITKDHHQFMWDWYKNRKGCFVDEGVSIHSDFLNGLKTPAAKEKMIQWLEEKGLGKRQVNYKLRDWVFSRQRYWGEPIPLVKCESCGDKKYNYIIIHGFSSTSKRGFKPWLKAELEKQGHVVWNPDLPNTNEPKVIEQVQYILHNAPFAIDENTVVVGHSLGGAVVYNLLEQSKKKIAKAVLVDPVVKPIYNDKPRPAVEKSTDWKFDWKKIKQRAEEFVIIGDRNFPIIKEDHLKELANNLKCDLRLANPSVPHFSSLDKQDGKSTVEPAVLEACVTTPWIPLPESELPLELPKVKKYEPTDTGESPLSTMDKWVNTKCPKCGGPAKRETDTMPNWAGSSWYFLRYCDPENTKEFASPERLKYWMPVDWYNGGMEHTVLHLLYSRFWNQFLYDIGVVPTREPYKKRTSHGMILGPDGEKMSKSRGNVINPDDMVEQFGADAFRTYIGFMGPFDQAVKWDTNGLVGVRRFLDGAYRLCLHNIEAWKRVASDERFSDSKIEAKLHHTIDKVTRDIDGMRFNTAISAMMEFLKLARKENESGAMESQRILSRDSLEKFVKLLTPFAPHLAEELWRMLGHKESITYAPWPKFDPALAKESTITIALQVNGKVRDEISVAAETSEEEIKKFALASEKVQKWLEGKPPKKVIYVKGKLVSIVV